MTILGRTAISLQGIRLYRLALRLGVPALALTLCQGTVSAQRRISLAEFGRRNTSDFAPAYNGQKVSIRGVVSRRAYRLDGYALLAIQDADHGEQRVPIEEIGRANV